MTVGRGVPVREAVEVEVKVRVVAGRVERIVLAEGVDVMVRSVPEMVVSRVVGGMVVVKVLRESPDVDTTVSVMGSVPVGVVTTT
jgi:hypothetical protein